MVVQRTIEALRERPHDERRVAAALSAITVVVILFFVWAGFFLYGLRQNAQVQAQAQASSSAVAIAQEQSQEAAQAASAAAALQSIGAESAADQNQDTTGLSSDNSLYSSSDGSGDADGSDASDGAQDDSYGSIPYQSDDTDTQSAAQQGAAGASAASQLQAALQGQSTTSEN